MLWFRHHDGHYLSVEINVLVDLLLALLKSPNVQNMLLTDRQEDLMFSNFVDLLDGLAMN